MLAQNDQPTELDGRKALTGTCLVLSQSLIKLSKINNKFLALLTLAQLCANSGLSIFDLLTLDVLVIMWGFMLLLGLLSKHIYLYIFYYSPSTQFPRAEILNYRNYVRNGYDVGSEIAKACRVEALDSDRQALEEESVSRGSCRHLGQTFSDLYQKRLGAYTHGSKCFQCHLSKLCLSICPLSTSVHQPWTNRLLLWDGRQLLAPCRGNVTWYWQELYKSSFVNTADV